jgi:multidrug efflux system outer membrane protein
MRLMPNYKLLILAISACVLGSSCRSGKLTTDKWNKTIPGGYSAAGDSASEATVKPWQLVFKDPQLGALIDTALVNNYDLRKAFQKVEFSRAGLRFHKGIRLPEISANLAASQRRFGDYTMDGVGNYDTQFSAYLNEKQQIPNPLPDYYVGLQTAWEIDLWGRLKNKKKAAAARFIASQYGKDLIVTNLIAEVARAYFELIALDKELQILEDNIKLQQSALDVVQGQKQAAKANELAVELLHAQLLSSKASHTEIRQNVLECESRLSFLCGWFPRTILRDTGYYAGHISETIEAGVPSGLLKNRPDIRQAESELQATNADVLSARAAFYPNLTINAGLGLQSFNAALLLETPASIAYNVLGGLTAPLLNRRKLKADLMMARSEQKQAYIQYEKAVVTGFTEVYNSLNNISNTKEMFDLKKEEASILRQSVITSSELFKAGRATYLEVIVAQKNALQSQLELVNYYKRQNTAMVDLYRSLGGGWK